MPTTSNPFFFYGYFKFELLQIYDRAWFSVFYHTVPCYLNRGNLLITLSDQYRCPNRIQTWDLNSSIPYKVQSHIRCSSQSQSCIWYLITIGGWMDRWIGGRIEIRAILRIAIKNSQKEAVFWNQLQKL